MNSTPSLNTNEVSKEALNFGLDIMKCLLAEAQKQKNHYLPYDALVLLQHDIHDTKTGKTNEGNCCADCEEFEGLEITHFGKISGSCQSGPDIPCATDLACEKFQKKKEDQ